MPFYGYTNDYDIAGTNIRGGTLAMPAVSGNNNMALGNGAGQTITTGSGVIFIGNAAGSVVGSATSDSVFIGNNSQLVLNDVLRAVAVGAESAAGTDSIAVGYFADAGQSLRALAIGSGSSAEDDGIAVGYQVAAGPAEIIIGQGTETAVQIGAYDLSTLAPPGAVSFWVTDYIAVGVDSNSATVNGSVVTGKLIAWVEDGGTNSTGMGIGKADGTAANAGATFFLGRSRGTLAAPTIVQNGDLLGAVIAVGNDGTDFATAARIDFEVDGVPGANDMPGRISFKVAPDGSQVVAEAMQINNAKAVSFSGDFGAAGEVLTSQGDAAPPIWSAAAPSGGGIVAWVNFSGVTGVIRASYNVSSVTKHATGQYTINFATPMVDENYALAGMVQTSGVNNPIIIIGNVGGLTVNGANVLTGDGTGLVDFNIVTVMITR